MGQKQTNKSALQQLLLLPLIWRSQFLELPLYISLLTSVVKGQLVNNALLNTIATMKLNFHKNENITHKGIRVREIELESGV